MQSMKHIHCRLNEHKLNFSVEIEQKACQTPDFVQSGPASQLVNSGLVMW